MIFKTWYIEALVILLYIATKIISERLIRVFKTAGQSTPYMGNYICKARKSVNTSWINTCELACAAYWLYVSTCMLNLLYLSQCVYILIIFIPFSPPFCVYSSLYNEQKLYTFNACNNVQHDLCHFKHEFSCPTLYSWKGTL